MSNKREDVPPRGDEDGERSTKRARLEQDSSQEERLPIMEIRRLAGKAQCREVQFDKSARVVAFKNRNDDVRINVYYTTGTVGTYLNHPRMGKTQLFRRNDSSRRFLRTLASTLTSDTTQLQELSSRLQQAATGMTKNLTLIANRR